MALRECVGALAIVNACTLVCVGQQTRGAGSNSLPSRVHKKTDKIAKLV